MNYAFHLLLTTLLFLLKYNTLSTHTVSLCEGGGTYVQHLLHPNYGVESISFYIIYLKYLKIPVWHPLS